MSDHVVVGLRRDPTFLAPGRLCLGNASAQKPFSDFFGFVETTARLRRILRLKRFLIRFLENFFAVARASGRKFGGDSQFEKISSFFGLLFVFRELQRLENGVESRFLGPFSPRVHFPDTISERQNFAAGQP